MGSRGLSDLSGGRRPRARDPDATEQVAKGLAGTLRTALTDWLIVSTVVSVVVVAGVTARGAGASGAWTAKSAMETPVYLHAAAALDGLVYEVGGLTTAREPSVSPAWTAVYDPKTDTWSRKPALAKRRAGLAVAASGGKIYAVGGTDGAGLVAETEVFDPALNAWSTKAALPKPRVDLTAQAVGGIIYAIGGLHAKKDDTANSAYDIATDAWSPKAPIPTGRQGAASAVVNRIVYVIGGYGSDGVALQAVEAYDPATDKWSKKASMPTARGYAGAAVANGVIYVIGGKRLESSPQSTVEAYDPVADKWTTDASMPTPRAYVAAASVNNVVYAVGGLTGSNVLKANEAFTPAALTPVLPPLPFVVPASPSVGPPASAPPASAPPVSAPPVSAPPGGAQTAASSPPAAAPASPSLPQSAKSPAGGQQVNTPSGTSVKVRIPGPPESILTFSKVVLPGTTKATPTTTGPVLPAGYSHVKPAAIYDVTTTATFEGTVLIAVDYSAAQFPAGAVLRMLHFHAGVAQDVTTKVDTQAKVIYGAVTSFSYIVITSTFPCGDNQCTSQTNQPVTISPSQLPDPTNGVAYTQTLTASGATTYSSSGVLNTYTFGLQSGSLPSGLTLSNITTTSTGLYCGNGATTCTVQFKEGQISGTPTARGKATFSISATDRDGAVGSQSYTVTVLDRSPVASADAYPVPMNTATVISPGVLGNDTDADGDALRALLSTKPTNGSVTLSQNGSFTYTPNGGFTGSDTFQYRASDGQGTLCRPGSGALWHFDEGTGVTTADACGLGYTGALASSTTSLPAWEDGATGKALKFDGHGYVVPAGGFQVLSQNQPNVTVEGWVRWDGRSPGAEAGTDRQYIYSEGTGSSSSDELSLYLAEGVPAFHLSGGATISASSALQPGTWHHIAAVRESSAGRLYLDGQLVASGSGISQSCCYVGITNIGRWTAGAYYFIGAIDELRAQSTTLTQPQIQTDMANASSPATVTMTVFQTEATVFGLASSSKNPSIEGQSVTFSGTVFSSTTGQPVQEGSVRFTITKPNGTTYSTDVVVDQFGQASLVVTTLLNALAVGTNTVELRYLGTSRYLTSTKTLSQVVEARVLTSIAVTPVNASIGFGQTQQYTATGTWNDGSSLNLTSTATWTSSNATVATISSQGLATATGGGNTTIGAASSGVTGSTTLFVSAADLGVVLSPASQTRGPGTQTSYSLTVTNGGPNTITAATVTLSLPAGMTVASSGSALFTCSGTSTLTCTLMNGQAIPVNGSGSVSVTVDIAASATGTLGVTAQVSGGTPGDPNSANDTATASVIVTRPVANPDAYSVNEGATLAASSVLANDVAKLGGTLQVTAFTNPSHAGSFAIDTVSGTFIYIPAAGYNGSDTFTYRVVESGVESADATVTITVYPINSPPIATNGLASLNEDATATIDLGALVSDAETPKASLSYVIDVDPANGSLSGSGSTRIYTPNANFNGSDAFTFHVVDRGDPDSCGTVTATCAAGLSSGTVTVSIVVGAVNDAPVVTTNTGATVVEGNAVTIGSSALAATDLETTDPYQLVYTVTTAVQHGQLRRNPNTNCFLDCAPITDLGLGATFTQADVNAGYIYYDADHSGNASDAIAFAVSDGTASVSGTFAITVTLVNQAPSFGLIASYQVTEDAATQTIAITGIGAGRASESAQVVTLTATSSDTSVVPHPTVSAVSGASATLTYKPAADAYGTVTITVMAKDNGGTADGGVDAYQQSFTIGVVGVNDAPHFDAIAPQSMTADAGSQQVAITGITAGPQSESSQTVTLSATSSDPMLIADPQVSPVSAGAATLTYAALSNANGAVTITVTARDDGGTNNGGVDTFGRTFTVSLAFVNHAPVALDDTASTTVGTAVTIDVLANDTDPDLNLDARSVTVFGPPAHGTGSVNGTTGVVTYAPDAAFAGTDTFTYKISDAAGATATATVTVEVRDNIAPTLSNAQVSADASSWVSAATTLMTKSGIAARVTVQDVHAGLVAESGAHGYSARYTTDGGASWREVPATSLSLVLVSGGTSTSPYWLTANGLDLIASATLNKVEFTATDVAGNTSSMTVTIAVVPVLSSIAVSPATATIIVGQTQQFAATGVYSDASTQPLTGGTWSVSLTSVASVTSQGLATAIAAGDATISATSGAISGTAQLKVAAPIALSPTALPGGTVGSAYGQTITATGGLAPSYSFAVTSGALPTGLGLSSSGGLAGTPTAAGSFGFTITATDTSAYAFTGSRAYAITVAAAPLVSIAVSPTDAVVTPGQTQQFTATGTFGDGSTRLLSAAPIANSLLKPETSAGFAWGGRDFGYYDGLCGHDCANAVTPDGRTVYVTSGGNYLGWNKVTVVDVATRTITKIIQLPGTSFPRGIAISPPSAPYKRAYIAQHDGPIQILDLDPGSPTFQTVVKEIHGWGRLNNGATFDGRANVIVFTPDGKKAYVSNESASSPAIIDTATETVRGWVDLGDGSSLGAFGLALNPSGTRLYVTHTMVYSFLVFPNTWASVVDTSTDRLITFIYSSNGARRIVTNPAGSRAYAVSTYGTVHKFDLTTNSEVGEITGLPGAQVLNITPDGKRLWVSTSGKTFYIIDLDPSSANYEKVIQSVSSSFVQVSSPGMSGISFSPDSSEAYLSGDLFSVWSTHVTPPGAVTWSSSAAGVATVDRAGKATAVTAGTTTISASSGSIASSVVLTVANTTTGSSVKTELAGPPSTTLTFATVTQPGVTSMTSSSSGSPPPTGFGLGNPSTYLDITTTAMREGSITVCVSYSGISFVNQGGVKLLHSEAGAWRDVTTSLDTTAKVVCGSVTSLSPFVVVEQLDTTAPVVTSQVAGTAGTSGWYVSDVTVTWQMSDAETGIALSTGCGATTLTSNTTDTTLTCTATNGAALSATASVTIKIDKTAPVITASTAPASPNGTNGWYSTTVTITFACSDAVSGIASCTVPMTLGEGSNRSATGTAVDSAGNSASATISGVSIDLTAPAISASANTSDGTPYVAGSLTNKDVTVHFDCSDALSGVAICPADVVVTATTASVTGTASDKAGNAAIAAFGPIAIDKQAPVIASHADVTAEATSFAGAVVTYAAPSATDDGGATVSATCAPASGSQFAFGSTTVTCNASDSVGNAAVSTTFKVVVQDTIKPELTPSAAISSESATDTTSLTGAVVTFTKPTATDTIDGALVVTCAPASGSTFPIGDSVVTCSATDAHGNSASLTFTVTVTYVPALSISDVSVVEGNTGTRSAVFTVSMSGPTARTVTVAFATADGTATVTSADYTSLTGTLTFAPGETSKTVTVNVYGDTTYEPDETLLVNLTAPTNATIARAQATGTLTNDDAVPTISISDASVTEGNGGASEVFARFTVTLSNPSADIVKVDYATRDGTATAAGADYTSLTGTLTFAPGETNKLVSVNIRGDTTYEPDEMLFIDLASVVNATLPTGTKGTGTIVNDDPQPTISINDVLVIEGNAGTTDAVFSVSLSNPSSQSITVSFATADGTATVTGADYTSLTGTLTFAPGETSKTVTVNVYSDTTFEPDETIFLNLTTPTNATIARAQATGTVTNDDAQPAISIADASVAEGNTATTPAAFTVNLSNPTSAVVTVDFATADGTALAGSDYTSLTGRLTFAPGETTKTVTIAVNGDATYEPDETLFVNLTAPTNATIARAQATGTVTNDDAQPAISIANVTVTEGNTATTPAVFTVTLSNPSSQNVTVGFATADGTATVTGADYTSLTGTLTFAPGETSKTVTVNVYGDTTYEPDETLLVNLTAPTNATIARAQATGTITNDDSVPAISINDVAVTEGSAGQVPAVFTVSLSNPSSLPITVSFSTADGSATVTGADYIAASGALTFAAGETTASITVLVVGDVTYETAETFFVNLQAPANATLARGQGIGTIGNDDAQPTIGISDVAVTEGNTGTTFATFTVTLSNPSSQTVTVNFATQDGTASFGSDYVPSSGTVSFAPGESSQTIRVAVKGETAYEPDETFFVNLQGAFNATIAGAQGKATIANDDVQPSISIADIAVLETNSGTTPATFTVTLSNPSSQQVTVSFASADGTALAGSDYTASTGTVTFAPGVTTQTLAVQVKGDTAYETDETFFVNLQGAFNATIAGAQGIATIANDDVQPIISIADVSVVEGNSGTTDAILSVSLSSASYQTVTVTFATADGTASAPEDYTAAAGTLTFAPGETSKAVTVKVNGDVTYETDQTILVLLQGATNATLSAGTKGVATVRDDDVLTAADDTYATSEDTTLTVGAPGVRTNDVRVDASVTLTAAVVSGPAHGVVSMNADGSFAYTPAANYNGVDTFTYAVSAGTAASNVATVSITVTPVNDAPVAADDAATTPEDTAVVIAVLANDSDVDGDLVAGSVTVTSAPAHGTTSVNALTAAVTYTPNADFSGSDTFTYRVGDSAGALASATVTITVSAVNDPPHAAASAPAAVEATSGAGAAVTLDASASSDVDNTAAELIYTWSGPFGTASGRTATVTLAVGTSAVTLTVRDPAGAQDATSLSVTVTDTTPPALALPAGISSELGSREATGPGGAAVSYATPTAGDIVDGALGVTCTPAAGSIFPIGATTVTCSATDAHGNVGTLQLTVTVVDTTAPALSLPASITAEATSASGAAVTYTATATDLVAGAVGVSCAPASGAVFAPGTTTVACSTTDGQNGAAGSFEITVRDTTAPVIAAHAEVTVEATSAAGAAVAYTAPAATDAVSTATVTCAPASGATFPLGPSTVTCSAADAAGNAAIATTFGVMVKDTTPPTITSVPANQRAEATSSAGAVVTFALPTATDAVSVPTIACVPASGSTFPLGQTTVVCRATDAAGNTADSSTALFSVTVSDTTSPTVTVPADMAREATSAAGAVVTYEASATDIVSGSLSTACMPVSGSTFALGTTTVACLATDGSGNTRAGVFSIVVRDTTPPLIVPPAGVTVGTDAGAATASGVDLGSPTTSDIVGVTAVRNDAPATFGLGSTTVTWTAVDAAGNSASATQTVTVLDREAPRIVAPAAVTVSTDAGQTFATGVTLGTPTAADNVAVASVTSDAPAVFRLGVTTVTWTATDTARNSSTAAQAVTVVDTERPSISAPADVTVNNDPGRPFATNVALGTPAASDNVGVVAVTNDAPAQFNMGTTTVTWTALDAAGNAATATQKVTVEDGDAPTITIASPGEGAVYAFGERVAASYACADALSAVTFCVGTTGDGEALDTSTPGPKTFTVVAYDAFGNRGTATVHYTVGYVFRWEQPVVEPVQTFKIGSTIPLKLQLTDASGALVTTAVAHADVFKLSSSVGGSTEPITTDLVPDDSDVFRVAGEHYQLNYGTRGLAASGEGTYRIVARLDDGTTHAIDVFMKR